MDDVLLRTSPEYNEFRQEILRAIHLLDTSIAAHRPTIVTESYLTGEEVMELFSLCPRTLQTTVTVGYFPTRRSAAKSSTRVLRSKRFWTETIVNRCDSVLSNSTGGTQCRPYCFYFIFVSIVSESFSYRASAIAKHPSSLGLAPLFVCE